jgi:uncharacterized protein RhaS with RHS repeats
MDDQNHEVSYRYDHGGRLVEVQGARSMSRYTYGNTYLASLEENGRRLVEFKYNDRGRIGQLSLADHRSYGFHYEYDNDRVVRSFVTGPDGTIWKFDVRS